MLLRYHRASNNASHHIPVSITPSADQSTVGDPRRSTFNIIWSCLFLIFSCTWLAIHPNIPEIRSQKNSGRWLERLTKLLAGPLRRMRMTVMAVIAPELAIMWAMRQWIVAGRIATDSQTTNEERKWTRTHGFFTLMGGFMLFDGNEPCRTLQLNDLESLSQNGIIDFPFITEDEIKDKSKGDMMSKGLVVVQTTWFIVQFIARLVKHLPITELELVTVAFAVLNFLTYWLWLDKPLNVERPFRVLKIGLGGAGSQAQAGPSAGEEIRELGDDKGRGCCRWFILPVLLFSRVLLLFAQMGFGDDEVEKHKLGVTPFYPSRPVGRDGWFAGSIGMAVAVVFGAIHCFAWSFQFPSHTEQILWRISSIVITCIPVLMGVSIALHFEVPKEVRSRWGVQLLLIDILCMSLYIPARLALLVLAFTTLRSLHPEAYQVVKWSTFLPHVA